MRFIKEFKQKIQNINMIKLEIGTCIIFILIDFVIIGRHLIKTKPINFNISIFDILCLPMGGGILGTISLSFPIIPIFAFIVIRLLDFEINDVYLIRLKSRKKIWNSRIKFIVALSFIYSLIVVFGGYTISGILLKDFKNGWNLENSIIYNCINNVEIWGKVSHMILTYKMLPVIFISFFLGTCAIGVFISMLKIKLKNIYVYLILSIMLFLDATQSEFSIIISQMTIVLKNWINPNTILVNYIYLFFMIFICYFVGKEIILDQDFINKKLEEEIYE
ncbi:hypothetical protein [Clostridium saccharoperbutylacetonicum]|uniref:hypothetical protein n=1 Tax=Clostridium saccharoperbutylacetonicum TaxID=36745 RepID=UPI0039ED5D25